MSSAGTGGAPWGGSALLQPCLVLELGAPVFHMGRGLPPCGDGPCPPRQLEVVAGASLLCSVHSLHLQGSTALSYKNGLPTSLAKTGQQWDMPNAWPPLQHMVIAGKRVTCGVWTGLLNLAARCCVVSPLFLALCGPSHVPVLPAPPSLSLSGTTQVPLGSNQCVPGPSCIA